MLVGKDRSDRPISCRKRAAMVVVAGVLLIAILLAFGNLSAYQESKGTDSGDSGAAYVHPAYPFDSPGFFSGVDQAAGEAWSSPSRQANIQGGIIPHHTLPSFLIAGFFRKLSEQHPRTIVLVGPNHPDIGQAKVLTSQADWRTPFGTVHADSQGVEQLLEDRKVQIADQILSQEHSVAAIMPYVKYYLPDTMVVPVIFKSGVDAEEVESFGRRLAMLQGGEPVIVAAVDFSHYLTAQEAAERDEVTAKMIESFEGKQLFGLGNDYLDSPVSIAVLLAAMRSREAYHADLLAHTNSGVLDHDERSGVTSYFVYAFPKEVDN